MDAEEFVRRVRQTIADEELDDMYRQLATVDRTTIPASAPQRWRQALALYDSLTAEQQETLFYLLREERIYTLASLFGMLDGVHQLAGRFEHFELAYVGRRIDESRFTREKVILSGDLQDYLFGQEQDAQDGQS